MGNELVISNHNYFERKQPFGLHIFFFSSGWPRTAYSNSKSFPLILKYPSIMWVRCGLRLARKTFTIQPRYFQSVCRGWMKSISNSHEHATSRYKMFFMCVQSESSIGNYLTVFFSIGNIRFPRCNMFSDLLFSCNEETQGYFNLEELSLRHLSFKVTALLRFG